MGSKGYFCFGADMLCAPCGLTPNEHVLLYQMYCILWSVWVLGLTFNQSSSDRQNPGFKLHANLEKAEYPPHDKPSLKGSLTPPIVNWWTGMIADFKTLFQDATYSEVN